MPLSCSRCQQGTHPPRLGCCWLLRMQPSGTGHKVSKKIRKKWSEACLKQLLQQMSQFSCFAESRFMEARLTELEQAVSDWELPGCWFSPAAASGKQQFLCLGTGSAQHPTACLWAPFSSACRDVQPLATAADAGK